MADLSLSLAVSRNPMTEPILAGQVRPQGVDWHVSALHPSEMFWRQLRYKEFDISEMSLSSLTIAASRGRRDWTAIPVFTTRKFFHTQILVSRDSGIRGRPSSPGAASAYRSISRPRQCGRAAR